MAGGAVGALVAYMCNANTWLQIIVFAVVSGILLIITKPFVDKMRAVKAEKTNADSLIGMKTVILEEVDNLAETGTAKINGVVWSVRNAARVRFQKAIL